MYESDCKFNDRCNTDFKKTGDCKLFVIRTDEGVVQVKILNNNARYQLEGHHRGQGMTCLQLKLQYVRHMVFSW